MEQKDSYTPSLPPARRGPARARSLYFMECHVAARQYNDADEVWDELRVGMKLDLVRDAANRYDPKAVQIVYTRGTDSETGEYDDYVLGYIPHDDNETIAALFDTGWGDIFECRLSRINPDEHYERQLRVIIRIRCRDGFNPPPRVPSYTCSAVEIDESELADLCEDRICPEPNDG